MEAISSFGLTESAKFEVLDTDVVQAKIAVQEVKDELQNFKGDVRGEVGKLKDAIGKPEDTESEGTFFGALAKAVDFGGGGVKEENVQKAKTETGVALLLSDKPKKANGSKDVPYVFYLGSEEFMKNQIKKKRSDFKTFIGKRTTDNIPIYVHQALSLPQHLYKTVKVKDIALEIQDEVKEENRKDSGMTLQKFERLVIYKIDPIFS